MGCADTTTVRRIATNSRSTMLQQPLEGRLCHAYITNYTNGNPAAYFLRRYNARLITDARTPVIVMPGFVKRSTTIIFFGYDPR